MNRFNLTKNMLFKMRANKLRNKKIIFNIKNHNQIELV